MAHDDSTQKKCPFDKQPCIKDECMAWSKKENLEEVERDNKEGFDSLLQVISMQEGISLKAARDIVNIRNDNERCKLIDPEQVI